MNSAISIVYQKYQIVKKRDIRQKPFIIGVYQEKIGCYFSSFLLSHNLYSRLKYFLFIEIYIKDYVLRKI